MIPLCVVALFTLLMMLPAWGVAAEPAGRAKDTNYWVEPMREVHAHFKGTPGTFAHFGDSITVSMAFWAPLSGTPKGMSPEMARAHQRVKQYMRPECWNRWKGPDYGNNGSMTIRWAHDNVDRWLRKLNPEVVLLMFGTNDVGLLEVKEYEEKTRAVVEQCLKNGTVVILSTIPPRSGRLDKSRKFAETVRHLGRELKVPVIDYFEEVLSRRPDDWDGSLPQFKNTSGDE